MLEAETTVVFRILGILAQARDVDRAPVLDDIADTLHLGKSKVERYMTVLQRAGAVRAEPTQPDCLAYSLTRYGLERLAGVCVSFPLRAH